MRTKIINAFLLSACLSSASVACLAVGLGNMRVESALGQPLKARIDLIGASADGLGSLAVSLASPQSYQRVNVPYSGSLGSLEMSIVALPGSAPYVRVTSVSPVTDPALDLLVKLTSPDGSLVHEYSLLLDPVGYDDNETTLPVINPQPVPQLSASPVSPAPVTASTIPAVPPAATQKKSPASSLTVPVPKSSAPSRQLYMTKKVKVHKGDNLTAIIGRIEPKAIDLDQALVAVFEANPHAFMGNNMNRLRSGVILRIPSEPEQQKIGPVKAMREVAVQTRSWKIYRQKLAKAVMAESGKMIHSSHHAQGIITTTQNASVLAGKPHDVLKLSRGAAPGDKEVAGTQALKDKIEALQEDAIARKASLKEANERILELEKTLKNMQALIAIKGQQNIQPSAKKTPNGQAKPGVLPGQHNASPANNESTPISALPVRTRGLMSARTLLNLAGVLVLVALASLLVYFRKRSQSQAEIETGDRVAPSVSLQPDPEPEIQDSIASHETDPLAEAEVFMAYERYDQAETILTEALIQEPGREDLAYKLLEVYSLRHKSAEFLDLAGKYQDKHAALNPVAWQTICQWGSVLLPDAELFSGTETTAVEDEGENETSLLHKSGLEEEMPLDGPQAGSVGLQVAVPEPTSESDGLGVGYESPAEEEKEGSDTGTAGVSLDAPPTQPETGAPENSALEIKQKDPVDPVLEIDSDAFSTVSDLPQSDDSGLFLLDLPENASQDSPLSEENGKVSEASPPEYLQEGQTSPPSIGQDAISLSPSKIDLDYSFENSGEPGPQSAEVALVDGLLTLPDFDFAGIDLNLDPLASGTEEKKSGFSDEVATHLDLARAYLEMGDQEGAREILAEIMNAGDANQQKEISELIEKCQ